MDSKFVITQLINAAVTVLTTIIVVRVTMKGSLEISPKFKQRLRHTMGRYGGLFFNALFLAVSVIGLVRWVGFRRDDLPNRAEVFMISFMTVFGLYMLGATGNSLLDIFWPLPPNKHPRNDPDNF